MTSKSIVFDIETAALPENEIIQFMPEFEAPGNIKDPEKIKAAIESKRKAWIEDAALSPITARVLAIGLWIDGTFVIISEPAPEAEMLLEFWDAIQGTGQMLHHIIGFNCCLFDLPFLIKRSWKLGVTVPLGVRRGRYWGDQITDLRDVWQCGDRQAHGSLDDISRHLRIGEKTGSGADFANLWNTDRNKAIEYLKHDLGLTASIAIRFGVL